MTLGTRLLLPLAEFSKLAFPDLGSLPADLGQVPLQPGGQRSGWLREVNVFQLHGIGVFSQQHGVQLNEVVAA